MKKYSILALSLLSIIAFSVGCGSENNSATATPPLVPTTPPALSPPPTPVLTPSEFVGKMLKSAIDLSYQNFAPLDKCSNLTNVVNKLQSTKQGSKGSATTVATQQGCDDSNHFGANSSVETNYKDFIEEGPAVGPTMNGNYSLSFQISDGDVRTTATSNNLTYNGKTYDFEKVFIDEQTVCEGIVKVNNVKCKVSPDCKSCKIIPTLDPNDSAI